MAGVLLKQKITWRNFKLDKLISFIYELWYKDREYFNLIAEYHKGGGYHLILTIYNEEIAKQEVEKIKHLIKDKIVVEIGAGIGLLAIEMAKHAKKVYAFELDPAWTWIFVKKYLYKKPKNLYFIFGDAREFADKIKPDIAVVYTGSGLNYFTEIAKSYTDKIILNGKLIKTEKQEITKPIRFKEDELFDKVFPLLKRTHRISKDYKVEWHKRIQGFEVDVYITWKSRWYYYEENDQGKIRKRSKYHLKSMILELKENDLPKVLDQAIKRRHLALFTYAVVNIPPDTLFTWLWKYYRKLGEQLLEKKIGLICFDKLGNPSMLLKSEENINLALDKWFKKKVTNLDK